YASKRTAAYRRPRDFGDSGPGGVETCRPQDCLGANERQHRRREPVCGGGPQPLRARGWATRKIARRVIGDIVALGRWTVSETDIRNQPDIRELMMARWGMPSSVFALKGRNSDPGVTNSRNVASAHWRRWLGVDNCFVVPFTSFSEKM